MKAKFIDRTDIHFYTYLLSLAFRTGSDLVLFKSQVGGLALAVRNINPAITTISMSYDQTLQVSQLIFYSSANAANSFLFLTVLTENKPSLSFV